MPKKVADIKIVNPYEDGVITRIPFGPDVLAESVQSFPVPGVGGLVPYHIIEVGRFDAGDVFVNSDGDFVFKNLVMPIGTLDEMTIAGEQFEKGFGRSYDEQIRYSEHREQFDDTLERRRYANFFITPIILRYAGMRVSYDKRNTTDARLKATLEKLDRSIVLDGNNPWQYNAECVQYTAGGLAVIETRGIPLDHPLYRKEEIALAGVTAEIVSGCGLDVILARLVGDTPEMVKEVFEYYYKPPTKKTYLWRCGTSSNGSWALVFGIDNDNADISANVNVNFNRPARGVSVEKIFFHKK